ncbi:aminodeoxychorismate synthase, component I [Corynebacterium diphtheriae]|nr:aminodeoxychorismate synthase, component I [Corynebacterium diphtheriae]CAB1020058.1 aminodeoxychorismate synthase, component I [Corynebacterium diphtheriae]
MVMQRAHILVVDNFDSFTYNIVDYLHRCGARTHVVTNNVSPEDIDLDRYHGIVISPGPGHPSVAEDVGISAWVLQTAQCPVLGVCLGMQLMVTSEGGCVDRAPEAVHGRVDTLNIVAADELFAGLPRTFSIVRYHSLAAITVPPSMEVTSSNPEGIVMSIRHRSSPWWGVQFHPESIAGDFGVEIIDRFVDLCTPQYRTDEVELCCSPVELFHALGGRGALLEFEGTAIIAIPSGQVAHHIEELEVSGISVAPEAWAPPGWYGYIGYEANDATFGTAVHAPKPAEFPTTAMMYCTEVIAIRGDRAQITAPSSRWGRLRDAVVAASKSVPTVPSFNPTGIGRLHVRDSRERYMATIERIQEAIRAGETYEVCLTTELFAEVHGEVHPAAMYQALSTAVPAPMRSLVVTDDVAVISASPERFITMNDRMVSSSPIKGTRKRSADREEDRALADDLRTNPKDRAENLMIVDLVRNDLARVCESGSVRVPELCALHSFTTVHQLISTVEGQLRPTSMPIDVLRATFPGGSMTGAPKHRTMHLITELEGKQRGVYSGCIGYIGDDLRTDLAMVIRTVVLTPTTLSYGVGGAIIALSDPAEEWAEITTKSRVLLDLLGQDFPQSLIIDSFLVNDGKTRGLNLHLDRFRTACLEHGYAHHEQLDAFFAEALRSIPATGQWFPRLEATPTELRIALRPAPQLRGTTTLTSVAAVRPTPNYKGLDLDYLAELRGSTTTDDALLVTPAGVIAETTTAAIIAWDGTKWMSMAPVRLESVTEFLLINSARAQGEMVVTAALTVPEAQKLNLWAVNSLHGVTPVTHIDKVALPNNPQRSALLRGWLSQSEENIAQV